MTDNLIISSEKAVHFFLYRLGLFVLHNTFKGGFYGPPTIEKGVS